MTRLEARRDGFTLNEVAVATVWISALVVTTVLAGVSDRGGAHGDRGGNERGSGYLEKMVHRTFASMGPRGLRRAHSLHAAAETAEPGERMATRVTGREGPTLPHSARVQPRVPRP